MSFDLFAISPNSESSFEKSLRPVTIDQHLIKYMYLLKIFFRSNCYANITKFKDLSFKCSKQSNQPVVTEKKF